MSLLDALLGRRLASSEAESERIKPVTGVSTLGLDALGSASYGPEAALTILIPVGAAGLNYVQGVLWIITAILAILFFSYRQTIAAYPQGGGSYTVAKENLGERPGLLAAASLLVDYILNAAVGISAGIGALESAFPALQQHTRESCLIVLGLITVANLRGVRQAGILWIVPTYLFVASLGFVVLIGVAKGIYSGGHPVPVVKPPTLPPSEASVGLWLLIRAFASGCTAMTGVEAVSNAVPIFRKPQVRNAQQTLLIICSLLGMFLIGIGYLVEVYQIGAMLQEQPGYQSIISQIASATVGRGWLYYTCIGSVLAVLTLSANTSFSDFPRLCRLLAEDGHLPSSFANLGRRLVYSEGILVLALISGMLLVIFDGITDRLIPLFAVGAFSAFTFSQAGMMAFWRKHQGVHARTSLFVNAAGAIATGLALMTIIVAKFTEGAWITILLVIGLAAVFSAVGRHYRRIWKELEIAGNLKISEVSPPLVIIPVSGWNRLTEQALRFSMQLGSEIVAVNISNDKTSASELRSLWKRSVEAPAIEAGCKVPRLEIVDSPFRILAQPLLDFVRTTREKNPGRLIAVVIPELVEPSWWEYLLHNSGTALLRTMLLIDGGERVVIISTAWHLCEPSKADSTPSGDRETSP